MGQTDDTDDDYTIRTLADDTVGLMDALNIERAHIFGISMGGNVAQEIAITYSEKVEKLILCSTQYGGYQAVPPSIEVINIVLKGLFDMDELVPLVFTKEFIENEPELIKEILQIAKRNPISVQSALYQSKATNKFRSCKRLKKINNPTLIMHGKKDILVRPENGEILAKLIPNAELVIFNNSAHSISAEEPDLFMNTILEFLE